MKKLLTLVMIFCILLGIKCYQNTPSVLSRIEVIYDYTVDGDTVYLIENGQRQKYRLLYIDTPEATTEIEPYGLEATDFTKKCLENALKIEIEYQIDNELEDQYGRKLVWIFVDGKLLQEKLAEEGLVEQFYDNGGNYTYKKEVVEAMEIAIQHKIGIYSE